MTAALSPSTRRSTTRPTPQRPAENPVDAGHSEVRLPWLCPVPDCEPPFDDELTGPDRVRALAGAPRPGRSTGRPPGGGQPVVGDHRSPTRPTPGGLQPAVVSAPRVPGWSRANDVGVRLTPSTALPPADRIGWMLAQAVIEVLAGSRPLTQLREHCAPDVFAGLEDQRILRGSRPPRLVTARVDQPRDGVAEVAAVFRCTDRVRAMAFRIQGIDGRWRITHLQIG